MKCKHILSFNNKKGISNHKRWCEKRIDPSCMKGINKGDKNGVWKGDEVGYHALHAWIKRHLSKPFACNKCGKISSLELANKSHEYKRDISDWLWLCLSCHAKYDNKIRFIQKWRKVIENETL